MKNSISLFALLILLMTGCTREVVPIEYGMEDCHWCQMKIMDPKFGSEVITAKGRTYKFDSAECLFHYLQKSESEHSHIVVTDIQNPVNLVSAHEASFLVSEKIISPMGGNMGAFSNRETA